VVLIVLEFLAIKLLSVSIFEFMSGSSALLRAAKEEKVVYSGIE